METKYLVDRLIKKNNRTIVENSMAPKAFSSFWEIMKTLKHKLYRWEHGCYVQTPYK